MLSNMKTETLTKRLRLKTLRQKCFAIFKKYGVLDYLGSCFDVLHTTGRAYIVDDIDVFINARKNA